MPKHSIDIGAQLFKQQASIEEWFEASWNELVPVFYMSVDLRHSGLKLAPIDVNLYPAGFNNLSAPDIAQAATQAEQLLSQQNSCQRIVIITENHTRNSYYLENVAALQNLFTKAGFAVKLSKLPSVEQTVKTHSGQTLVFECVSKENGYLCIDSFIPDCIILNNDLSEGASELLVDVVQPIFPSPKLGWYNRAKSQYFEKYNDICKKFSKIFGLDDWLINPLFTTGKDVDFKHTAKQTTLINDANQLLNNITQKYQDYDVIEKPYLVMKANAGSYGMGVITIDSIDNLRNLSRKQRQHMSVTKGNRLIQDVIIQEGIPTITSLNKAIAEPVIYLIGSKVVGGFYRTHTSRNAQSNLNTPGMELVPMTLHKEESGPTTQLLYAYQVIARLAAVAAAFEMKEAT